MASFTARRFDHTSNENFIHNQEIADAILRSPVRHAMESYLGAVCRMLIDLHDSLDLSIEDEIKKATLARPRQGGRVLPGRVRAIPSEGNLREKIGFINDIAMGNQSFLWKLIAERYLAGHTLPLYINERVIAKHLERIHTLTGIKDVRELVDYYRSNPSTPMPSSLIKLPVDGAVMLSRYTEYPMLNAARIKRPDETASQFLMHEAQTNPPISKDEADYMRSCLGWTGGTLPWLTGAMCWTINDKNFYADLARHYDQLKIAGPSGSTDGCMEIFELFNDFDVVLATLCCAAWLCNRNDHSLWEVLLAALPYGLNYSSRENANAFVLRILHHGFCPRT
jgi:hypothetical protein